MQKINLKIAKIRSLLSIGRLYVVKRSILQEKFKIEYFSDFFVIKKVISYLIFVSSNRNSNAKAKGFVCFYLF